MYLITITRIYPNLSDDLNQNIDWLSELKNWDRSYFFQTRLLYLYFRLIQTIFFSVLRCHVTTSVYRRTFSTATAISNAFQFINPLSLFYYLSLFYCFITSLISREIISLREIFLKQYKSITILKNDLQRSMTKNTRFIV